MTIALSSCKEEEFCCGSNNDIFMATLEEKTTRKNLFDFFQENGEQGIIKLDKIENNDGPVEKLEVVVNCSDGSTSSIFIDLESEITTWTFGFTVLSGSENESDGAFSLTSGGIYDIDYHIGWSSVKFVVTKDCEEEIWFSVSETEEHFGVRFSSQPINPGFTTIFFSK